LSDFVIVSGGSKHSEKRKDGMPGSGKPGGVETASRHAHGHGPDHGDGGGGKR
jgi:hypothetical protein